MKGITIRCTRPRLSRNSPCPCGSTVKFKRCHGGPQNPTPGTPHGTHAAGHEHEQPAFFLYTAAVGIPPVPVEDTNRE